MPGKDWSFELKTRLEYNFFNLNQSLRLSPTLTYFWIRKGKAFLNFFLQEEQVYPLNYGKQIINEQWTYLGFLFNFNQNWMAGAYGSKKVQKWVSTDDFERIHEPYVTSTTGTMLGLLLLYKFEE